jgi:hypothetical protein
MMDSSAGNNGAAASIITQDMTATKLLFFNSMVGFRGG